MMYFRIGVFGINLILETDNAPFVKGLLDYVYEAKKYNPWKKIWETKKISGHIFKRKLTRGGHVYFEVGIGWAFYILTVFKDFILKDDYDAVLKEIVQPSYRTVPFKELRDYQNEDVLHLLKYKFGLYSCYTGYGKSQVIAVLANEFRSLDKKVLLVTPSTKARDELVKRIYNLYGIEVSTKFGVGNIQAIITNGLLNKKELKTEEGRQMYKDELATFDVLLSDEVEYTINESGFFLYDNIVNAQYRYGFSGTADKGKADIITTANGICNPTVAENKDLICYFGTSLVYRLPEKLVLHRINILTQSMNPGNLGIYNLDFDGMKNVYMEVMNAIFTNDAVCKSIVKIIKAYPLTFIPINNLAVIISNWIENYFIGTFRILLVSHEGYTYYDLEGNIEHLTLQEACDKIREGLVDVIPSTSSGFRALDFPNLKNILIFSGKVAGNFLQQIGRVARQKEMNIITLDPENKRPIPIYSKGTKERDSMLKSYYRNCTIIKETIHESDL